MSARRLSQAGLKALAVALVDLGTVNRWREKTVTVDGSQCWWWTGAISGRGHGRFYFARGELDVLAAHPAHPASYSRTGSPSGWCNGVQPWTGCACWGTAATRLCVSGPTLSTSWLPRMRRTGVSEQPGGS